MGCNESAARNPARVSSRPQRDFDRRRTAWASRTEFGPAALPVNSSFRRADENGDGMVDLADPVFGLNCLFLCFPGCLDAHDANDGQWDVSGPIFMLGYLFNNSSAPPVPFPDCATGRAPDSLDCQNYGCP